MSSVYHMGHIIKECVEFRNRAETSRGRPSRGRDFYESAWSTLNTLMESKLKKRQGCSIGGFGDFTWEFQRNGEETRCRPIYLINDNFVKDHHIRHNKFHLPGELCSCEEINYSNLAVKFSNCMTKDMIYSALRDIFKKIGEYVDRFCEFDIEFTFGTWKCKERRVRFEFNYAHLAEVSIIKCIYVFIYFICDVHFVIDLARVDAGGNGYEAVWILAAIFRY